MENKIKECIKKLGWSIYEWENYVDLRKYSPAGEDFGFSVTQANIVEEIIDYAYNFDADEHAEMWVENRHSVPAVPQGIRELIQDADDIKDMLNELADELNKLFGKTNRG